MKRIVSVLILLFVWVGTTGFFKNDLSNTQNAYRAESIGPYGGVVYQVVIDPENANHLYAVNGSLFQSHNQGVTWSYIPIKGEYIRNIAIDPRNPNILYIASDFYGLFVSADKGKNWAFQSIPNQSILIGKLVVNKLDSSLLMGTDKGLFRSQDQGISWKNLTESFGEQKYVLDVELDPFNSSIIYLSIAGRKFFISFDSGSTWQERIQGIQHDFIESIAVDPKQKNVIYLACISGIYKTTDQGLHWTLKILNQNYIPPINQVVVNPIKNNLIYATTNDGVFLSDNAGERWIKANKGIEKHYGYSLCVNPLDLMVYVCTNYGFFKTVDPNMGWKMYSKGLSSQSISKLFQDPFDKNLLYGFITNHYLCRYDRLKLKWDFLPTEYAVSDVVADPNNRNVLYAVASNQNCVIRSSDGGKNWVETGKGMFSSKPLSSIQIDPNQPKVLFVGTNTGKMSGGDGLFKSITFGKYWEKVGKELIGLGVGNILINQKNSRKMVLLAGDGMSPPNMYASLDSGNHWELCKMSGDNPINRILLSPINQDEIFCITAEGLYHSKDWGKHLERIFDLKESIRDLVIDPTSGLYYLVTEKNGIKMSSDAGKSWTMLYTNINPPSVFCSMMDSNEEEALLYGTNQGVIRITNRDLVIKVGCGQGGAISPKGENQVIPGGTLAISISPDPGYLIEKVVLDQKISSFNSIDGCTLTLSNVNEDHSLFVSFLKKEPTVKKYLLLQINQPQVIIDGKNGFIDSNPFVVPIILNNRTLLPIRGLIEALGGGVGWDEYSREVTINYRDKKVSLIIGNNEASVNGQLVMIDPKNTLVVPIIFNSRTYLPLRFIAESIGFTVYWDEIYRTVTLVCP